MIFVLAVMCLVASAVAQVQLPPDTIVCPRNDPNRDECIKSSLTQMIPRLHAGIPGLNIHPIDPLVQDNLRFDYDSNGVNAAIRVKQSRVYGLSRAIIEKVRTQISDTGMTAEIDFFLPRLYVEGSYRAEGRFNSFKLNSKGTFNVTLTDVRSHWVSNGDFVERNGEIYLQLKTVDNNPTVGGFSFSATGLLPDPELNKVAVDFVNQYWQNFYVDVVASTKKQWEPLAIDMANEFLLFVPLRLVLP